MFKAIWPIFVVAMVIALPISFLMSANGIHGLVHFVVGVLSGVVLLPWMFKRLDAAWKRGDM